MKTKNHIPTLLALILQLVVSGQTLNNQITHRTLPVLGNQSGTSLSVMQKPNAGQKELAPKKNYPILISSQSNTNNTIQVNNLIDNNTFNYFNNKDCYATIVYAKELLKQANELFMIEKTLRAEAKTKQGEEKLTLLKGADELLKQSEIKQIQASEIYGKLSLEKFKSNTIVFNKMIFTSIANETILDEAKYLNSEAVYTFKMAKEMREEAYSFKTNSAKLGTMGNAEEKETLALQEQESAIVLLKKSTANNNHAITNDLAVK